MKCSNEIGKPINIKDLIKKNKKNKNKNRREYRIMQKETDKNIESCITAPYSYRRFTVLRPHDYYSIMPSTRGYQNLELTVTGNLKEKAE